MEQRLFLVACIMYAFSLGTRFLKKKGKLSTPKTFGGWHASFLFIILGCAAYVLAFVMGGGTGEPIGTGKIVLGAVIALVCAVYGYYKARKAEPKKQEQMMKADLEWSNTVYFAGFVASFVMFFFIQAFKIPSASMRYTLVEGDHLFVNKAAYGFRLQISALASLKRLNPGILLYFAFRLKTANSRTAAAVNTGRTLLNA